MGGCNWQEKSFSVAVRDRKNDYRCYECKVDTSGEYKLNGGVLCKKCFGRKATIRHLEFGFNTHKDLAYNFTTDMFGGKPVNIKSKTHFKTLLKHHNMADASIKECKQEAEFRKRINVESDIINRRKTAESIMERQRDRLKFRRK